MNKEDYLSLEVTKILYQKGFEIKGVYLWTRGVLCPTLYEAAKWLRKNHNIYINIGPSENEPYERMTTWTYDIYDISTIENKCIKVGNENFKLYEDCFNKAIDEALKLI